MKIQDVDRVKFLRAGNDGHMARERCSVCRRKRYMYLRSGTEECSYYTEEEQPTGKSRGKGKPVGDRAAIIDRRICRVLICWKCRTLFKDMPRHMALGAVDMHIIGSVTAKGAQLT